MTSLASNTTIDLSSTMHMQMSSEDGDIFGLFLKDVAMIGMEGLVVMSGLLQSVDGSIFGVYADDVEVPILQDFDFRLNNFTTISSFGDRFGFYFTENYNSLLWENVNFEVGQKNILVWI